MDIITLTQSKRAEILAYVKPRLSFESYSWVSNVFNELNKRILFDKDDRLAATVFPMYENLLTFFEEFCDEITPGGILYTIYSCMIESDVLQLGNKVETLPEFVEEVEMDDWEHVSKETIAAFDLRTNCVLAGKYLNPDTKEHEVWGCGLMTLNSVPYHLALRKGW